MGRRDKFPRQKNSEVMQIPCPPGGEWTSSPQLWAVRVISFQDDSVDGERVTLQRETNLCQVKFAAAEENRLELFISEVPNIQEDTVPQISLLSKTGPANIAYPWAV